MSHRRLLPATSSSTKHRADQLVVLLCCSFVPLSGLQSWLQFGTSKSCHDYGTAQCLQLYFMFVKIFACCNPSSCLPEWLALSMCSSCYFVLPGSLRSTGGQLAPPPLTCSVLPGPAKYSAKAEHKFAPYPFQWQHQARSVQSASPRGLLIDSSDQLGNHNLQHPENIC